MKQLFFFFIAFSLFSVNAQDSDTNKKAVYSEVGLYTMDTSLDEATIKKELQTIFPDASFIDAAPEHIEKTLVYVEPVTDVPQKYPVYGMNYLNYFAKGLTKAQKENLIASKNAFIIAVFYTANDATEKNKLFYEWIHTKLKDTEYVAYDAETREYFLADTWKIRRVDAWSEGIPDASRQIITHSYRKDKFCRTITLGMKRFGLPDIVIDDSACSNTTQANQLITVIAQLLFEGNEIKNGDFMVDFNAIQNADFKKAIKETTIEGAAQKATIRFKEGTWEEGDPTNFLIQVDFENEAYENPQAYENTIYSNLFGVNDEVTSVDHNQAISEASERAKRRLPALKKLFNNGLSAGSTLLLKAPFTTDTGGREWMWVEVTTWETTAIEGILQNEPHYIKNLKAGTKVTVKQADIFDYILYKADGTSEGNETGRLIQKYGN